MKSFGNAISVLVAVTLVVALAACSNSINVNSNTQIETTLSASGSSQTSVPSSAASSQPPQSSTSQSAPQPQAPSVPRREQQPILEEPITGTNNTKPSREQQSILEEPITGTNETRPYSPENEIISNPDPFGLMGEGDIALAVFDTASQRSLQLNYEQAREFLSKINFGGFNAATMKQEIVLPDIMTGEAGTEGNYIQIGLPHTNVLYVYDTQSQALIVGAETRYYDMPSDTYIKVKSLI